MFDIYNSPFEDGDFDDEAALDYRHALITAFAESPEGQAYAEEWGEVGWVHPFLEYGMSYRGETPPEMTTGSIAEIVFELFPRKVSTEPESAPAIIAELRTFWRFLQREYGLSNAAEILRSLEPPAEDELHAELSDPSNFGMAKSFVAAGKEAGFDMSSEAGMYAFMAAHNAGLQARLAEEGASERIDRPADVPPPRNTSPPRPKPAVTAGHLTPQKRREREKELRRRLKRRKRR